MAWTTHPGPRQTMHRSQDSTYDMNFFQATFRSDYVPEHERSSFDSSDLVPSKALFGVLALALVLLASLAVRNASAQSGSAVPFLQITPDSRQAGMGGAGAAVADDAFATFWNPAGLAYQTDTQVAFSHANWLPQLDANLYYEYLTGTYHVEDIGTFGAQLTLFNKGETEQRTGFGETGVVGTFRSYDLALGASYGRQLNDRFAVGGGLRMIYSKLAPSTNEVSSGTAFGVGLDLAGMYTPKPFTIKEYELTAKVGANIQNLGPAITYSRANEPLPTTFRLGGSLSSDLDEYNRLTVAMDLAKKLVKAEPGEDGAYDAQPFYKAIFTSWGSVPGQIGVDGEPEMLNAFQQMNWSMGLEYWYDDLFALRTGYYYESPNNGDRQHLSFGAGVRYNMIGLDMSYLYGLTNDNPMMNTVRLSLMLNLNKLEF